MVTLNPRTKIKPKQPDNRYAKCGEDETTELLMAAEEIRAVLKKHGVELSSPLAHTITVSYAGRKDSPLIVI